MTSYSSPEELLADLSNRGGSPLGDSDMALLRSNIPIEDEKETARLGEMMKRCWVGFFDAVAKGDTFADPDRIPDRFGPSLEDNYPEASPTFLRFAYSYWTLKIALDDFRSSHTSRVATHVLQEIESPIQTRFLPTPGPFKIDPDQRERDQRKALEVMAPQIDIEDFMRGNPILIRDRQSLGSSSTGCLLVFLLSTLPPAFAILSTA